MTGFQLSSALGPALGGFLIAATKGPAIVYLLTAVSTIAYAAIMLTLSGVPRPEQSSGVSLRSLVAGFSFVWRHPIVLPALALDLFAVLLGGATSMLPVYAKTILDVDATGFGFLDAAPAVGAMAMAIYMAHRPPLRHAGRDLLWAVAMFGVATIIFGLSHNFYLSLAMLFCTGAVDNISVIVRHTLVQMLTPDRMRGRVSAVNGMFIGASNELGTAESGFVASYTSPQISVVSGGVGTLLVVAVVTLLCTQLRRYGRLGVASAVEEAEAAPRGTHHPAAAAMGTRRRRRNKIRPDAVGSAVFALPIAQRLDHGEHLFVGDETPPVAQLVAVDGLSQLASRRRQLVVTVGELPALTRRDADGRFGAAAIEERGHRRIQKWRHVPTPRAVQSGRLERRHTRRSRPAQVLSLANVGRTGQRVKRIGPIAAANRPTRATKSRLSPTSRLDAGQAVVRLCRRCGWCRILPIGRGRRFKARE